MAGFRHVLAMVLMLTFTHAGLSQAPKPRKAAKAAEAQAAQADKNALICKIYPLAELGDESLGQWIADTIPQMIASGSWSQQRGQAIPYYGGPMQLPSPGGPPMGGSPLPYGPPGMSPPQGYGGIPGQYRTLAWSPSADTDGKPALAYFAPAKVMVINHTVAVHVQVDAILKGLKQVLPQRGTIAPMPPRVSTPTAPMPIAPIAWVQPTRVPESMAYNKATAYQVPPPLAQPKHLFHLIIRYEGDGVVDANAAELLKTFSPGSVNTEPGDKPKVESAKSPALSQLFNFIIRYEGDGIVDSNVVELVKTLSAEKKSVVADQAPAPAPSNATFPMRAPMGANTGYLQPMSGMGVRSMPPADNGPQSMANPPNRGPTTLPIDLPSLPPSSPYSLPRVTYPAPGVSGYPSIPR